MAPSCSPVTPLALWRRRDSTNSAPLAPVSFCLPDGGRLQRELRINYNMSEVRALLADEIQFDPDQLDIYCDSEPEPVADSLVLAGLDVEHRQLTLHVQLREPAAAPVRPAGQPERHPPAAPPLKPVKGHDSQQQPFARRVYEWGMRRRCSLRWR
ncbi:hypothetical protein FJT64_027530 [Amphibalanus amphitrite]|uniref:Ubiquitin-like domain-containing protein n=1 Tax=Amphibalanus amphitrite TaxID=1232801 RepID=A0A6A4W1J2_AMPAM|nr:uncharacterized protein LOC122371769 [Amphibalanus amphitrite]XP_043220681.1 uncharacterized protein LOC122381044 [Amphibalanus amphitrite]KAF0299813.1 hypothetical protein FJT64_027530 [Amphibalanus amphitrite]